MWRDLPAIDDCGPDRDELAASGEFETIRCCPICRNVGTMKIAIRDLACGVGGVYHYMRCCGCGGWWLFNRFTRRDIGLAYPDTYYSYSEAVPVVGDWVDRALAGRYGRCVPWFVTVAGKMLQAYPPAGTVGRVLDIGCGNGARLHRLRRAGWMCSGVEGNVDAAARARDEGLDVRHGSGEKLPFGSGAFDAVVMAHSIEHCHDPRQVLREVHRVLRVGGHVVVTTPNVRSLTRVVFGSYWRCWDAPRHLVLFDRKSMVDLLSAEGFGIQRIRGSSSGDGLVGSAFQRFGQPTGRRSEAIMRMVAAGVALLTNWSTWSDEMEITATKVPECCGDRVMAPSPRSGYK